MSGNWYGALSRAKFSRRGTYAVRGPVGKRALVVAVPSRNMRARTVAAGMGLRNRAPRAQIKGAIAPYGGQRELKYVDVAQATYACDQTGSVTALNLLAVGDDNNTRDGRQVTIKSVQVHGIISPVDATTAPNKWRVMLVWDNAANSGAIATIAQILSAATGTAFPLVDNSNRFTILVDRTGVIGGFDTTATQAYAMSPTVCEIEIYKKINQVTQYSGTTAAIGSIQNGALLMVTIGSAAAAVGATLIASTRVRFTDN